MSKSGKRQIDSLLNDRGLDVPEPVSYDNEDRQKLDDALVEAIRHADALDNAYLGSVLRAELGCVRLDGDGDA